MAGEIRRGWQEAAMGVSGQAEISLSPKTQKTIITIRKSGNKLFVLSAMCVVLTINRLFVPYTPDVGRIHRYVHRTWVKFSIRDGVALISRGHRLDTACVLLCWLVL